MPSPWIEQEVWDADKGFHFGHVKFGVLVEHPSGNVLELVGYAGLGLRSLESGQK